jgi:hypothetical protein
MILGRWQEGYDWFFSLPIDEQNEIFEVSTWPLVARQSSVAYPACLANPIYDIGITW